MTCCCAVQVRVSGDCPKLWNHVEGVHPTWTPSQNHTVVGAVLWLFPIRGDVHIWHCLRRFRHFQSKEIVIVIPHTDRHLIVSSCFSTWSHFELLKIAHMKAKVLATIEAFVILFNCQLTLLCAIYTLISFFFLWGDVTILMWPRASLLGRAAMRSNCIFIHTYWKAWEYLSCPFTGLLTRTTIAL